MSTVTAASQPPPMPTPGLLPPNEFRAPKGKSYALLIGNEAYKGDEKYKLHFPVRDVEMVARALREHHGFVEARVERNVPSAHLDAMIKEFFQKYGRDPEARLFVWFAGHGTQIRTASGQLQSFLLPTDMYLTDDPSLAAQQRSQIELKGVKVHRLAEYMTDFVRSRQVMIVIDSCFSGAIFEDPTRIAPLEPAQHLSRNRWSNKVRHVIAAGNAKQEVYDDGKFADFFVLAITGQSPALSRSYDEFLTGHELGNHLIDVMAYHRKEGQQRPRHRKIGHSLDQEGEFVFELPRRAIPPPPVLAEPTMPGLAQQAASRSLDAMADRCKTWRRSRHPLADAVATQVAEVFDPRRGIVHHAFDAFQVDHLSQTVVTTPDIVHAVTVDGPRLRVRYARNDDGKNYGDMVLVPIRSAASTVLRGAWMRLGSGFGCVEIQLGLRQGTGVGLFYQEFRNRLDVDIPFFTKVPIRSSLRFTPRAG